MVKENKVTKSIKDVKNPSQKKARNAQVYPLRIPVL